MNLMILTYSLYLALSIALTVWVARTLHTNGKIFLVTSFSGNAELAASVNHLLVVGFYLVNLGFVALYLKLGTAVVSGQEVFEALAGKLGIVLLALGVMHFMNIYVFNRIRRRVEDRKMAAPPVAPVFMTAAVRAQSAAAVPAQPITAAPAETPVPAAPEKAPVPPLPPLPRGPEAG